MADLNGWYSAKLHTHTPPPDTNKRSRSYPLKYENRNKKLPNNSKPRSEMRITELLLDNLGSRIDEADEDAVMPPISGDVPELALRTEYFMGIKIGWPFPEMNVPQKQMSIHILKGLQQSKHVVLESPTGTGKSAVLLCSVLAWQRHHRQNTGETVRIVYCSRTHSQVAQCVKSLKQTPYRPNMAVLGSRDKLCIHETVSLNKNNECRARVRETEKHRKSTQDYKDDEPSTHETGDDLDAPIQINNREHKPCCPHYRQLTSQRSASLISQKFRNTHSSYGVHDLEDLVQFGRNPYQTTVQVKKLPHQQWGMILSVPNDADHPKIVRIEPDSALGQFGKVNVNDWIFAINGNSTQSKSLEQVCDELQGASETLTLVTGKIQSETSGSSSHSMHSTCPYYISRALEKHAELVFCPYNYILDPGIRKALNIELESAVVILDEAHNVEDVLRNGGSGTWGEFQLCEMISTLQYYAQSTEIYAGKGMLDKENNPQEVPITEVAHELMEFLESIVLHLIDSKKSFEKNGGADMAVREWEQFRTPSTKHFEMHYFGPDGRRRSGKPQGCERFFETLSISPSKADKLTKYANIMLENIQGRDSVEAQLQLQLFDDMVDAVTKLATAMEHSEHFYVQSAARVNSSFEFVAGKSANALMARGSGRNKPKSLPYAPNRGATSSDLEIPACKFCQQKNRGHELVYINGAIRHGHYNNGATPPWEAVLVLDLLTPSLNMKELAMNCRSVILASGSLAPLPSLCAELGLAAAPLEAKQSRPLTTRDVADKVGQLLNAKTTARLQDKPPPLEAGHVINLNKQLLAVAIGQFPSGEQLTVSYRHYQHDAFIEKLGDAVASVIESIPRGGVLVFLPSYNLLKRCIKAWNPESSYDRYGSFDYDAANIWSRFEDSKGKVVVEPTAGQSEFDAARQEYGNAIKETGSCILFAVFRGKMSEGISFNDNYARGVICIGIPFPSSFDRGIKAKKSYNDEQRNLGKREDILSGNSWYSQTAYRAIAQALGRCIRHVGDYGTVILMDSRHCDESPPDHEGVCPNHRQFPKWMRAHIRTLVRSGSGSNHHKTITGGWQGLKQTMERFFAAAPVYTAGVLQEQQERLSTLRAKVKEASEPKKEARPPSAGSWSSASASLPLVGGGPHTTLTPMPSFRQASVTPSTQPSQPSAVKSECSSG